jgi:hypothetical protein
VKASLDEQLERGAKNRVAAWEGWNGRQGL